jgi:hypothetical protein
VGLLPVIETVALHHCPSASSTRSISVITAVHVADALEREAESDQTSIAELDGDYLGRLGLTGRLNTWRNCDRMFPWNRWQGNNSLPEKRLLFGQPKLAIP